MNQEPRTLRTAPPSRKTPEQEGYRKGDEHTGGGGSSGGGGKQREPAEGWEKGDRRRSVDDHHSERDVPAKPGRKDERPRRS